MGEWEMKYGDVGLGVVVEEVGGAGGRCQVNECCGWGPEAALIANSPLTPAPDSGIVFPYLLWLSPLSAWDEGRWHAGEGLGEGGDDGGSWLPVPG